VGIHWIFIRHCGFTAITPGIMVLAGMINADCSALVKFPHCLVQWTFSQFVLAIQVKIMFDQSIKVKQACMSSDHTGKHYPRALNAHSAR
jgi:hypothetical protein